MPGNFESCPGKLQILENVREMSGNQLDFKISIINIWKNSQKLKWNYRNWISHDAEWFEIIVSFIRENLHFFQGKLGM